jgi:hypothetical protein
VAKEVVCIDCGGLVLEEQSNDLKMQLSSADELESINTQTFPEKKGLISSLGSQLAYVSRANPGEIFKSSNPYGIKDYGGKRGQPVMTSNLNIPYQIAKAFGRNGDWDNNGMKFIIDYKRDSWFAEASIIRYQLCERYRVDPADEDRLAAKDLQGYSNIIIQLMPELISRLSVHTIAKGRLRGDFRDENRNILISLLGDVGSILGKLLEIGDTIANAEDGFNVEESDIVTIYSSKKKKKTIDILEGRGGQQFVDEELDVGRI